MLAYAFQVLQEQGYKKIATEEFDNTAELCAAILYHGLNDQIKRGLGKEYIEETDSVTSIHGKINISDSIKTNSLFRKKLICTYDDFSVNSTKNQIIKATIYLLIRSDISKARKKDLKKLLVYLNDVDIVDLHAVNWNMHYDRNNATYRMLIGICYLVYKGLLQTQADGASMLMDFFDEQHMHRLYEKFILEYYKREHPELKASASQIPWQLDDERDEMLPIMQSDIYLEKGDNVLIIDAKYYSHTTQVQYDKHTIYSANLYQIFTYVKNKEAELSGRHHKVSGMLLYAKTDEEVFPDNEYSMSGNRITVKTLDLDKQFDHVRSQLDEIVMKTLC